MLSVLFSKTGLPVLLSVAASVLGAIDNAQAREAAGVLEAHSGTRVRAANLG